jgi:hypothetical protein
MQIKQISVTTGRVLPYPRVPYSNCKPGVTLTAELAETDDPHAVHDELSRIAEDMVEKHSNTLIAYLAAHGPPDPLKRKPHPPNAS